MEGLEGSLVGSAHGALRSTGSHVVTIQREVAPNYR